MTHDPKTVDLAAEALWSAEPIASGQRPRNTPWSEQSSDTQERYHRRVSIVLDALDRAGLLSHGPVELNAYELGPDLACLNFLASLR